MFVYLSKILPAILAPFSLVLLLLVCALLLRKWRTRALGAAFVLLLIPASPLVSNFLVGTLERQYPDNGVEALPSADAIVVLGGTIHIPDRTHPSSHLIDPSDRLLVALRLYRAQKAPLIVCSGGNLALFGQANKLPEAEVMSSLLEEWGVPKDAILAEGGSVNTRENAILSKQRLASRNVHKILLVTSAMHVPRALATFRKAGFEVIPAPADFLSGWDGNALDWIPNPQSMIDSERALREWLGLWTYRIRGWA